MSALAVVTSSDIPAKFCPDAPAPFDELWCGETVPLEAIPEPERFHCVVKQVNLRRKVGSIVLPDQVVSDQEWSHGLAVVVKTGPAQYQGAKFADMGLSQEKHGLKQGDLVFFEARAPRRMKVDGELYAFIPDDAVLGRFDRRHVHRVSFTI
jgi:co-chaperonin GroES (HSP10)